MKKIVEITKNEAKRIREKFPDVCISKATVHGKVYLEESRKYLLFLREMREHDGTIGLFGEEYDARLGITNKK